MDFDSEGHKFKANKPKAPKMLPKSLDEYYMARIDEAATSALGDEFSKVTFAAATEAEQARREILCLDLKMKEARREYAERKKLRDARWEKCDNTNAKFFDGLCQVNGFFQDMLAKREKHVDSYLREHNICIQKDRDIRRMQKELAKLKEVKETIVKRDEKFSVFKSYLEKVCESSDGEYNGIKEIIDRYNNLAEVRVLLARSTDVRNEMISIKQKALEKDVVTKENEVLAYRNYLSEMTEYQDEIMEIVSRLEEALLRIKTTAAQRTKVIGQMKMAIDNIYRGVCKQMHRNARIKPNDTLGQLRDIQISVKEMHKLTKDIKYMLKAANATALAERAARERAIRKAEERQKRLDKLRNIGRGEPREIFDIPPTQFNKAGEKISDLPPYYFPPLGIKKDKTVTSDYTDEESREKDDK